MPALLRGEAPPGARVWLLGRSGQAALLAPNTSAAGIPEVAQAENVLQPGGTPKKPQAEKEFVLLITAKFSNFKTGL